jgi:glycosyltransferase involved in cell wall biosynthesis
LSKLSIIICTFNPDLDTFKNCLRQLDLAITRIANFELIIVDNNSTNNFQENEFIKKLIDKNEGKILREIKPGLTAARIKGINESIGDLIVFIDDDNLIASNFLEKVIEVNRLYPWIGSFSGSVSIICNQPIPKWTKKYWGMLVHRELNGNYWSNIPFDQNCMPCGAGLVVVRNVAEYYVSLTEKGQRKFQLDRVGNLLLSGGDNDLAMCACDLGLGMGLFSSLRLEHLLSIKRFEFTYLKNLAYNIYFSAEILKGMRGQTLSNGNPIKYYIKFILTFFNNIRDGAIQRACLRGSRKGIKFYYNTI